MADVLIVGAGPAGLECAYHLAAHRKVLLLESSPEPGHKVCAGGLTRRCIDHLQPPRSLLERSFSTMRMHTRHLHTRVSLDHEFLHTVRRSRLIDWMRSRLPRSVRLRCDAHVRDVGENEVVLTDGERIGFNVLVGADGPTSSVRRSLGLPVEKIGQGIQFVLPYECVHTEVCFDPRFHAWYSWIFPQEGRTIVGAGGHWSVMPMWQLKRRLLQWCHERRLDVSESQPQSGLINCDDRGVTFGNIFLAGDAAGLASPLSGEGIYQALRSGEDIARRILNPRHRMRHVHWIRKRQRQHMRKLSLLQRSWLRRPMQATIVMAMKEPRLARHLLYRVV